MDRSTGPEMSGERQRSVRARSVPAHSEGFVVAALTAPAIALTAFALGLVIASLVTGFPSVAMLQVAGGFLLLLVFVFITGAIPSLVFGAIVLCLIQLVRLRQSRLVLAVGGGIAASLYVAFSLAVAFGGSAAAMFFAPWAILYAMERPGDLAAHLEGGLFWAPVSIVLSGMAAGLIYARYVQRG